MAPPPPPPPPPPTGGGRSVPTKQVALTLTLRRPQPESLGLGFTLRGGAEHGLGHYVSGVEAGSEASSQGLMAGDQIVGVNNNLDLEGTTHKEAVKLINSLISDSKV